MKSKKKEKTELNKLKDEFSSFFNKALPHLIASFLVLIIFFLVSDAYEYLTTEYWWLQNSINYTHTTIFLFLLILLISIFNWEKIIKKFTFLKFIIPVLFVLSIFAHQRYSFYYQGLQKYPKFSKISKDWGLTGSWVKIEGRNFGEAYEEGKVYLDNEEMIIKKWSDKEIIFEIPIKDIRGNHLVTIINKHDRAQKEEVRFEVR